MAAIFALSHFRIYNLLDLLGIHFINYFQIRFLRALILNIVYHRRNKLTSSRNRIKIPFEST